MTSRPIALFILLPTILALAACGIERRQDRREDRRQDRNDDEVSQTTHAADTVVAARTAGWPELTRQ